MDAAETDAAAAFAINALAPRWLAAAARDAGALLVHVSTDYVFDGCARAAVPRGRPAAPAVRLRRLQARRRGAGRGDRRRADRDPHERRHRPRRQRAEGRLVRRAHRRAGARGQAAARRRRPGLRADDRLRPRRGRRSRSRRSPARGLFHVTSAGSCSWHELAARCARGRGPRRPDRAHRARGPAAPRAPARCTRCSTARATSRSGCSSRGTGATRSRSAWPLPGPARTRFDGGGRVR